MYSWLLYDSVSALTRSPLEAVNKGTADTPDRLFKSSTLLPPISLYSHSQSTEMFISKLSSVMEGWKSGSTSHTYEELILILPIMEHRERRARSPAVSSGSGMSSPLGLGVGVGGSRGDDLYKRSGVSAVPLLTASKGLLNTNKRTPRLSVRALTEL